MNPKSVQEFFYVAQIVIGVCGIGLAWFFLKPRPPESGFKDQIPNPDKSKSPRKGDQDLANARMKRNEPLRLSGIRIDGLAHEILGVSPQASEPEIQAAYRELIKQYHPDKVGRPDSREWKDATRIAEALHRARSEMLQRRPKKN